MWHPVRWLLFTGCASSKYLFSLMTWWWLKFGSDYLSGSLPIWKQSLLEGLPRHLRWPVLILRSSVAVLLSKVSAGAYKIRYPAKIKTVCLKLEHLHCNLNILIVLFYPPEALLQIPHSPKILSNWSSIYLPCLVLSSVLSQQLFVTSL